MTTERTEKTAVFERGVHLIRRRTRRVAASGVGVLASTSQWRLSKTVASDGALTVHGE